MKKWFFLLIIVILGALQVTILDYLKIFHVRPDLLLITLVVASLNFDLRTAIIFGAFAGIIKDVFGASAFGLNTLLFPLWSFLLYKLSREITVDDDLIRMGLVAALVIIHNIAFGIILISKGEFVSFGIYLRIVIVETVLTTLVSPLVFMISRPVYSKF